MKLPLSLIVFLTSFLTATIATAAPYEAASCDGLIVDNRSISIKLRRGITDGTSASRIDMYTQDLSQPNQPINFLGGMDCSTDKDVGDEIVCETILGETYKINKKSLTATESGIGGDAKPYTHTFTKCVMPRTPTENRSTPLYLMRFYKGHVPP